MKRWLPPFVNPFKRLQPSQRLQAAARAAGVEGGKDAIDAWARESGWFSGKHSERG